MKTTLAILMLGAFDLFFLSKTMHKAMRRAAMASAQSYGLGHSQPTGATKLGNNARKNSMAHKWASMVRPSSLRVGDGRLYA